MATTFDHLAKPSEIIDPQTAYERAEAILSNIAESLTNKNNPFDAKGTKAQLADSFNATPLQKVIKNAQKKLSGAISSQQICSIFNEALDQLHRLMAEEDQELAQRQAARGDRYHELAAKRKAGLSLPAGMWRTRDALAGKERKDMMRKATALHRAIKYFMHMCQMDETEIVDWADNSGYENDWTGRDVLAALSNLKDHGAANAIVKFIALGNDKSSAALDRLQMSGFNNEQCEQCESAIQGMQDAYSAYQKSIENLSASQIGTSVKKPASRRR